MFFKMYLDLLKGELIITVINLQHILDVFYASSYAFLVLTPDRKDKNCKVFMPIKYKV